MTDGHTRESLLNLVERAITGEPLVDELQEVLAAHGGRPKVLRPDSDPEAFSQALQRFCENETGLVSMPPGYPWDNGCTELLDNRPRKECLNRNYCNTLFEAQVVIGDFRYAHNHRYRGCRTPAEQIVACSCAHAPVASSIT